MQELFDSQRDGGERALVTAPSGVFATAHER